ncbi:hypothetical protein BN1723_019520, partial [Verticillium longisporum]
QGGPRSPEEAGPRAQGRQASRR